MNNPASGPCTAALPARAPSGGQPHSADAFRDYGQGRPPADWRQIPTDLSGARLYRFAPPDGGEVHWQVETTLNGRVQRRRYTSELRARAWLAVWDKPRIMLAVD